MLKTYKYPKFSYVTPPELGGDPERPALGIPYAGSSKAQSTPLAPAPESCAIYPVVVVGAGPVGMSCAVDLRQQGIEVLLVDEDDTVSIGSRGVCYAKRTLEILDRLGVGDPVIAKGVSWNVGRTFFREHQVYQFDLLPEAGHERPAMINLQQYYLEEYLQQRCEQVGVQMRWRQKVDALSKQEDHVLLRVEAPEGSYELRAAWVVAADGARSSIRRMMGLDFEGRVFTDRFLIADVVMQADFPAERWFWFDPPFHPNQSVLLHKQADQVWRIDFQLGWDADPEEEKKPEKVLPRIRAMLGEDRTFELEWVSVYTFQCRRLPRLRHGRVLFAGDSAHQVSPFGARGANSGIQDAENLAWKLARVLRGESPPQLLESYDQERGGAADENILNSTRSTDFITPKSTVSRMFRDATLHLAQHCTFAQRMVNSGRLSLPTHYLDSPLSSPDQPGETFHGELQPGSPLPDAPLQRQGQRTWLLRVLERRFALLVARDAPSRLEALAAWTAAHKVQLVLIESNAAEDRRGEVQEAKAAPQLGRSRHADIAGRSSLLSVETYTDLEGLVSERFDLQAGSAYLIRPDQHLAARFRKPSEEALTQALRRACGESLMAVPAA